LAVIPQGTLDFESETVDGEYSLATQEEDFERALFAQYIEILTDLTKKRNRKKKKVMKVIGKTQINYQIKYSDSTY
jgi:hypothetical protein